MIEKLNLWMKDVGSAMRLMSLALECVAYVYLEGGLPWRSGQQQLLSCCWGQSTAISQHSWRRRAWKTSIANMLRKIWRVLPTSIVPFACNQSILHCFKNYATYTSGKYFFLNDFKFVLLRGNSAHKFSLHQLPSKNKLPLVVCMHHGPSSDHIA